MRTCIDERYIRYTLYLNQKGKLLFLWKFRYAVILVEVDHGLMHCKKVQFGFVEHISPTLLCLSGKNENKWQIKGNFVCAGGLRTGFL